MDTVYKALKNRCPRCGHRLVLRQGNACAQVSGDVHDPAIETRCPCRKHRR